MVRCVLCAVALLVAGARAAEPELQAAAKPTVKDLSQWVMTYYQHPDPDQFVTRVRQMVEFKVLRGNRPEANEVFLGKVMAANPKRIAGWLDELADLDKEDAIVIYRAAWISEINEANEWLKMHGPAELVDKPPPPLLTDAPLVFEPYHLDQLWEWFFATGDEKPVKRIIGFFQILPTDPEPGKLPALPEKPARFDATNFRVAYPAFMSTLSLAVQQDRVFEILRGSAHDSAARPRCRAWITQCIQLAEKRRAALEKKGEAK